MTSPNELNAEKRDLLAELREDIRIAKHLGTSANLTALKKTCADLERELEQANASA